MTVFECFMFAAGFAAGVIVVGICFYKPIKRLRRQLYRLRGQVYYWSKQMPVSKKRGRPAKKVA
tara:strand:- start:2243 stop:2434 length:192 start_codon:yes stop_codon:yes gene_type:complete